MYIKTMKRTNHYLSLEHMSKLNFLEEKIGVKPSMSLRRALDIYLNIPTNVERIPIVWDDKMNEDYIKYIKSEETK